MLSKPAPFNSGPQYPPQWLLAANPVSGALVVTLKNADRTPVPVYGPVDSIIGFSGASGSIPLGANSISHRIPTPLPPRNPRRMEMSVALDVISPVERLTHSVFPA